MEIVTRDPQPEEEPRPDDEAIDGNGFFQSEVHHVEETVYGTEEASQQVQPTDDANKVEPETEKETSNEAVETEAEASNVQFAECSLQTAECIQQERQADQSLMMVQEVEEGDQREQYVLLFRNDEDESVETYVVEGELKDDEETEEQPQEPGTAQPASVKINGKKCFKCDECDYVCKRRNYIKIHKQKVHVTPREMVCYLCQGNFASTAALYAHMGQEHAEELPYECEICGYRARARHRMVSHKLSHDKEPRYKCDFCNFASRHKYIKTQHELTHQQEKPFGCSICGYKGRWRSSVYMHIKKRHGDLQGVEPQPCVQERGEALNTDVLAFKTPVSN